MTRREQTRSPDRETIAIVERTSTLAGSITGGGERPRKAFFRS